MSLIVDASVAIKWFVVENLHEEAMRLLDGSEDLHAPDLLVVELANVAWKKARRKEIAPRQARAIAAACLDGVPTLHASTELIERASHIALELDHPVYDCVYLACAEALGGVVVTADPGFQEATESTKFASLIMRLEMAAGRSERSS